MSKQRMSHEATLRVYAEMPSANVPRKALRAGAAALRFVAADIALEIHKCTRGGLCIDGAYCRRGKELFIKRTAALMDPALIEPL